MAVDYYTEAVWENRVELTAEEERKELRGATFGSAPCMSTRSPCWEIRERTLENVGYGPITLPPFEYDTNGLRCARPPPGGRPSSSTTGALPAGRALRPAPTSSSRWRPDYASPTAPTSRPTSRWTTRPTRRAPPEAMPAAERFLSALYLYDAIAGGVGHSVEKIFELDLRRRSNSPRGADRPAVARRVARPACRPCRREGKSDAEPERFRPN